MNKLRIQDGDYHLVPFEEMPVFKKGVTLQRAVKTLEEKKKSGFILEVDAKFTYYTMASALMSGLESIYGSKLALKMDTALADVLKQVPQAFLRVFDVPMDAENVETLQNRKHAVFKTEKGWYLNHEEVRNTLTEPFVFYCINKHPNFQRREQCIVCRKDMEDEAESQ